ncbi:MAG: DUF6152 family protein [Steroidobacteraceae bacterium]
MTRFGAALLCGLAVCTTATAHHSASAFDRSKPYSMTGTVKKFIWANPHAWIHVDVPDGKGGSDTYELEGPGLNSMARSGWTGRTLRPGDKIKVVVAPYRDGTKRGEFMAIFKDGQQLKF